MAGKFYTNTEARLLNITSTEEGGETRAIGPGATAELTDDDLKNPHVKRWIDEGYLVSGKSADDVRKEDEAKIKAQNSK